jgi:regulator of protease activity HflC (stomatin/prohibitin superfamily)
VAICLAASAISFIFSRFVAGMAKQPVWQNLRGGASWTVGTSIITLAIAVGLGFRFFDRDGVIATSAKAIPWFLLLLAGEIVFNFILNIYRPRVPGETPRPAFDSRILSLFAAPDNIVRSINEAVNYQFGFDVTSSWGYQLLLRSITRLVLLGVVVLIALNMIVIVEPDEQAVKLSRGRLLGDAHGSGVLWKLPWPLQSAETYSVSAVQELHLTPKHVRDVGGENVQLWTDDLSQEFDAEPEPFIVGNVAMRSDEAELAEQMAQRIGDPGDGGRQDILVNQVSLVDAEVVLQYRIKPEGGLLDYLRFSSDEIPRRGELPMRKQALKAIALREATQHFSRLRLDEVLQTRRLELASALEVRIQQAFDDHSTGIEVVAVNLPILAPSGDAAPRFEDVATARQNRLLQIAQARQFETSVLSVYAGDLELVDEILAGIAEWERLRSERGPNAPETVEQRVLVENMLVDAGGQAAADIAGAERDRWVRLMEARTDAKRLAGQLAPYHAAPDLYRLRRLMGVYATTLNDLRKYVIGIDPSRVHMDFDITELNPLLNIGDAIPDQQGESES